MTIITLRFYLVWIAVLLVLEVYSPSQKRHLKPTSNRPPKVAKNLAKIYDYYPPILTHIHIPKIGVIASVIIWPVTITM